MPTAVGVYADKLNSNCTKRGGNRCDNRIKYTIDELLQLSLTVAKNVQDEFVSKANLDPLLSRKAIKSGEIAKKSLPIKSKVSYADIISTSDFIVNQPRKRKIDAQFDQRQREIEDAIEIKRTKFVHAANSNPNKLEDCESESSSMDVKQALRVARMNSRCRQVLSRVNHSKEEEKEQSKGVDRKQLVRQQREAARIQLEKLEQSAEGVDNCGVVQEFESLCGCRVSMLGYVEDSPLEKLGWFVNHDSCF